MEVFLRNLVSTLNVGGKRQIFYGNKVSKNNHIVGTCNTMIVFLVIYTMQLPQ